MRERVITALIGALLFIPLIFLGGWPLEILLSILAVIGLQELHRMKEVRLLSMVSIVASIGVCLVVLSRRIELLYPNHFNRQYMIVGLILFLLICTVIDKSYDVESAGISTIGIFYIGFGFYSFIQIRNESLYLLFLILFVIWITDSGAYLIGRKFGKRKLSPLLSPNKTIEGAIGGTIAATLFASIYLYLVSFTYSYAMMIVIMVILSVAGQFGDLIESGMKRHFDVKDSGNILPGHGGILDRFDSMLFVLSIAVLIGLA